MPDNAKSTREHLIDVGLDLMHQHGYQATGMKGILNSANVPKGSFHHHFGSKEDFAAAALEKYTAREAEHFAAFNDSKTLPLKRLKRYFSDLVKVTGQSGPIPGCMGAFHFGDRGRGPAVEETHQHVVRALAAQNRDSHRAGSHAEGTSRRHGS